jgi:serine/threonine protein kinase
VQYPLIGKQLGNYQLIQGLGRGGYADVYLAEDIGSGKKVAIKILHARLDEESEIQNFFREARVLVAMEHPNIVEVYHSGSEQETPYIVMKYCAQGSLRSRYPKGTLVPLNLVVEYVKHIARALQYIHDEGLIHRDVKPHNMLLDRYNNLLLSDFGISLVTDSRRVNPQSGAGTAQYMSPEQAQGKAERASDQYSLAVVAYEWLTGEVPFNGINFAEIATKHVFGIVPSLRRFELLRKGILITTEVEAVILKALAKEPEQRYGSISEFANALEKAASPTKEDLAGNYRITYDLPISDFSGNYYIGKHTLLEREATIKLTREDDTDEEKARFKEEARLLSQLQHPNIPVLYDAGIRQDGRLFMATQLVLENLKEHLEDLGKSKLSLHEALEYIEPVGQALYYLHKEGYVHQDVKESNIHITKGKNVLLSGFYAHDPFEDHLYTHLGAIGTFNYMAPERLKGRELSRAADQYALAVVTYRLMCGQLPFTGARDVLIDSILFSAVPTFESKGSPSDPEVEAVLQKAMAKEPEDRYNDVLEFVAALQAINAKREKARK